MDNVVFNNLISKANDKDSKKKGVGNPKGSFQLNGFGAQEVESNSNYQTPFS